MAFEISKTGYSQIEPLFAHGYNPEQGEYHNIGQLQTPYQGKKFNSAGDYGPPQATRYYTDYNRNYPYILDADFRASGYIPGQGCCFKKPGYSPCYEASYPEVFIPSNYFSPKLQYPFGHTPPVNKYSSRPNSGTVKAYIPERKSARENYSAKVLEKGNFDKLAMANNGLRNTNNFYPFGKNLY